MNADGEFRCVYVNVEVGQAARENVHEATRAILSALARATRHTLDDQFVAKVWRGTLDAVGPNETRLGRCCRAGPRRTRSLPCS